MTIKRNTPREKKRKLSHTMKLHMTRYARPFAIRLCNGVSRESLMWLLRRGEISFEHSILSVANITDSATEETACPENVSQTATRTLATSRPGQAPAPRQVSCLASSGLELARSSLATPRSQHSLATATPILSTRYRYHSARSRALWHRKYKRSAQNISN